MIDAIEQALVKIRAQQPLVLCLTNFVTAEFVSNSLLALGAAPIMSLCDDELDALVKIASSVYINLGTLNHRFIALAQKAVKLANPCHKPVVLDPVGAGATDIRTATAQSIMPLARIIRGNASEILALGGNTQATKGVETTHTTDEAQGTAAYLALKNQTIVIVSGPVDCITNGSKLVQVPFGSAIMPLVTGMGCAMTAVIAAFHAVIDDPFEASLIGTHYVALCGETASCQALSPGTFKTAFIDQLHKPNFSFMREIYVRRR